MSVHDAVQQSFGEWLRQQRRARDLTQEELARQVGCSAITLRKLEAETRRPSKQVAERLADALQVPPAERVSFLRFARGDSFAAPAPSPPSPAAPRHNLPLQLTSFVGRTHEIEEIRRRLDPTYRLHSAPDFPSADPRARLVTLTGAGGSGKTRLALE